MDQQKPVIDIPSPLDLSEAVGHIASQSQALLQKFFDGQSAQDLQNVDPLGVLPAFAAFTEELARDPGRLLEAQVNAWTTYLQIWQTTAQRLFGMSAAPVVDTPSDDRRFKAEDWEKNPFFDYLKQTYLATSRVVQGLVAGTDGLDEKTARKIEFYTNQYLDALAPTNFALTNPQVLHATVESGGRNLLDGLKNFLADIDPKDGKSASTRMVDSSAFELGRNVAITSGQDRLPERAHAAHPIRAHAPPQVHQRPLLIIPPWINKYYILDLQPKQLLHQVGGGSWA